MNNPLERYPKDLSPAGLKVVREVLKLSAAQNMISPADAANALKILAINPQRRIARLGHRLARIKDIVSNLSSFERSIKIMAENAEAEYSELRSIVLANTEWALPLDETQLTDPLERPLP